MDEVKERLSDAATLTPGFVPLDGVGAWQQALVDMSDEDVRTLVVQTKEDMVKAGRLEFDWQAAKAAKLERKRLKELQLQARLDSELY